MSSFTDGISYGHKRLIQNIVETHWKVNPEKKLFTYNDLLFIYDAILREEGKPYQEGTRNTINFGFNNFRMFVQHLLYRNLANYDSMILLTSEKGTGKSSAAIMIAREWCKLIGIQFNPARHIAYNNSDVSTKIDLLNKFEPIVADEAVRFASSEDWARRENKELKKKLAQVRTKHLLFILCFPLKVYKVEKNYLESNVNYWCDLFGRGIGVIYVKDKNPVKDPWRIKDFSNVGSYTEFTSVNKIRDQLKKHPNFWQIIKFPKPSDTLYAKYLKVREANVYDDANVLANVSKTDIYNALLILSLRDIMQHDTSLSMNRIILHIKNEYDMNISKAHVQGSVDDAKQLVNKIKEQALNIDDLEKPVEQMEINPVDEDDMDDIEEDDGEKKQLDLNENY